MNFAKYELATGRIVGVGGRRVENDTWTLPEPDGTYAWIEIAEPREGYYIDVTATPHAVMVQQPLGADFDTLVIAADGVDAATLSPIPAGTEFTVDGQVVTVTDGSLVITAEDVGSYRVRVHSPQYVRQKWIVEAS